MLVSRAQSTLTPPSSAPLSGADAQFQKPHTAKTIRWRVIHACEYARDILALVEGQVAAGMRPYLVTPQGSGSAELYLAKKDLGQPQTLSLLRAWQDVRNWRKSLLECDPENTSDLVHAHSFASGMAGVRNISCVVYDLYACIEEAAISAGQCERGSWMSRSFRVAEQFILSHAQAVVVHSLAMKSAVEERGATAGNIFLIPAPMPINDHEFRLPENNVLHERFGLSPGTITYFVAHEEFANGELSSGVIAVLEAFALVVLEIPESRLLIGGQPASFAAIRSHAERLGIIRQVLIIDEAAALAAMQASTVVIATGDLPDDPVKARQPNDVCLRSLALGKPLLAADVPRNRDASPEGRGCLWFVEKDVRDLAHRIAFLAQHEDFRASLSASGRAHILQARNSTTVGHQYDAAYRHAISRRKTGGPGQPARSLLPVNCAI